MKFKWDINKEQQNLLKHGVTFEQASYVFSDPFALSKYDDNHSDKEERWILLLSVSEQVISWLISFCVLGRMSYCILNIA